MRPSRFSPIFLRELDELAAVMKTVVVEAGVNVVTVDDYGSAIYFIEEGEADVATTR